LGCECDNTYFIPQLKADLNREDTINSLIELRRK
jgi:hypothetical protein